MTDQPITIDWLRETAPAGSTFARNSQMSIILNSEHGQIGIWFMVVSITAGLAYTRIEHGVASFYTPPIRTRDDLRDLWKSLTGKEWGE
jgi:hypothetical protein